MSVRRKGEGYVVEIYDPVSKRKQHVRARDFGMEPPTTERQAKALERAALNARDARRPGQGEETVDAFAARWTTDFPRGESTNINRAERVRLFATEMKGRTLRSVTPTEARQFALAHPGRVPSLRAMFGDAALDRLVDDNPFAGLGGKQSEGRAGITVLTRDELDTLVALAEDMHGPDFGPEFGALLVWSAYTCLRPGETCAARFSLLRGDVYDVRTQFNSRLGREAAPKNASTGEIFVPEPARRAVLDKPRRLGDDLMFRSKRGKQLRQGSLHHAWDGVRKAFTASLPAEHHLRRRLAIDPLDRLDLYELRHLGASYMLNDLELEPWVVAEQLRHTDGGRLVLELYGHPSRTGALDRIRRAFSGDNVRALPGVSGDSRGTAVGGAA